MTLANLEKHHARLKWLSSGEFTERDFDYTVKANDNPNGKKGESGRMTMGDFKNAAGQKRKELIMCKAEKALAKFEKKYPNFKVVEKEDGKKNNKEGKQEEKKSGKTDKEQPAQKEKEDK